MKNILLILIALPFLLFSCGDTIDELSSIGTFKSTITGDVEKQFDGTAAFVHTITTTGTEQGSLLAIGLSKVTDQSEIISLPLIGEGNTTGIEVGTYNYSIIGAQTQFIPVYKVDQSTYSIPDLNKTNRVIISSITGTLVKGEFEINLLNTTTQKPIKIVGTFSALGTTETE